MIPRWIAIPVLCLGVPLGGCETLGLSDPDPETAMDAGPVCPATAVLADAVKVTKLRTGSGPANPMNVVLSAEMTQARLDCDYDQSANTLSVDLDFQIRATPGPAATGDNPQLDFFVAVVDADNNIVAKTIYHSQAVLNGRPANTYTQSVNNFSVPLLMDRRPVDYQILTGFQLTPDELAFNRIPRSPTAMAPAAP